jgi:hypothetical protein
MHKKQKVLTVLVAIVVGITGFSYFAADKPEIAPYLFGLLLLGIIYAALFFVLKPTKSEEQNSKSQPPPAFSPPAKIRESRLPSQHGAVGTSFGSQHSAETEPSPTIPLLTVPLQPALDEPPANIPAPIAEPLPATQPGRTIHCDIGWKEVVTWLLILCAASLFAGIVDNFLENLKTNLAWTLGTFVAPLVLIPIGAVVGAPFWFFVWLSKSPDRVSFKPFVLLGTAIIIVLGSAGRHYARHYAESQLENERRTALSRLENERRTTLSSLELVDARLSHVGTGNSLVKAYREQVPTDQRSDDELTLLLGKQHDQDSSFASVPDFVEDYQRVKLRPDFSFDKIEGKIRNNGSKTLSRLTLKILIYASDGGLVGEYPLTLYSDIPPYEMKSFSENVKIERVPKGFKWNHQFVDGNFR